MSIKLNPVFQTEGTGEDKGMYLREGSDYYTLELENGNTQMAHDELVAAKSIMMNGATSDNPLVHKDFVNSSISHMAANPKGNWTNWSSVPSNPDLYPADADGKKKPSNNDYIVVQDMTGYTNPEEPKRTYEGTWRFTYIGEWDDEVSTGVIRGKNGWKPIYQVNEKPLTEAQVAALNSGATSTKITNYDNHINNTNNPHNVTKTQIGLGNVDNTSDTNKPVSNATQTELNKKVNIDQGSANANKFLKTDSNGNVIVDYLSSNVREIQVVDALPATTDANTLYLIKETT